jgi:sugar (pentulose or hexulose) kinase
MCGLADSGSGEHEVEPTKAFGSDLLDLNQWWWSKQEIGLICRLSGEEQLRS